LLIFDNDPYLSLSDTDVRKKELFAKVRQGRVRILFGSTFKMGAGTNVQDKLVATHDVDCPWRPADLEQRAGRIVRQGNKNAEVKIFRYATNGTFDSYLWQTVENKQKFISQIMSSKSPVRTCEDVDETSLSYAEIKALCAGNPLIAEKMNLDIEVAKLRLLKSEHQAQHYRLEDNLLTHYPKQEASAKATIKGLGKDIALYAAHKEKLAEAQPALMSGASAVAPFAGMTIDGVTYTEKEPAAKALLEVCKTVDGTDERAIGEYMGFQMAVRFEPLSKQFKIALRGTLTYTGELGSDAFGNITRINNTLESLPKRLEAETEKLAGIERQQEAAKQELEKPFSMESELAEMEARLALLNADLNIDGDGGFDVENDTDERASGDEAAVDDEEYDDGNVASSARPDSPQPAQDERRMYVVGTPPVAASSAPAKPSILGGIRGFTGSKSESAPARDHSSDRAM
jgi:hypothetical protein